jgi:hypothetical protein
MATPDLTVLNNVRRLFPIRLLQQHWRFWHHRCWRGLYCVLGHRLPEQHGEYWEQDWDWLLDISIWSKEHEVFSRVLSFRVMAEKAETI